MKPVNGLLSACVLAASLGSAITAQASTTVLPTEPNYNQHKGQIPLVDEQGRELILQGLNSGSGKHAHMRRAWEQPEDVAHQAINLGYNTHRFLIFWDHIMPERGVINHEYLDDVERRLQWFADNDMHVIIDMHQDNWGQQCDGNGAPAWASIGTAEPAPGAPWWIIAASPCVVDSVNNFYRNNGDIQAEFVKAWVAVAERLKDHPAVFGYDLMNEPTQIDGIADQMVMEMLSKEDTTLLNTASLTTVWVNGKPQNAFSGLLKDKIRQLVASQHLVVPESYINKITEVLISRNKGDWGSLNAVKEFEAGMLSNLYQKVINGIRQVDSEHYIFVEPMSISVNNGSPTYLRRLDDPRNGDRRLGYIPHMYPRDLHEGGAYKEKDFNPMDTWEKNQREFVYDNNMAWLLGEFGHSNWAEGGVQFLEDAVNMLERNKLGWQYWDSSPGGWGPLAGDKISEQPNAFALVNVYPRAVSGRIESYEFDRDLKTFSLKYRNSDATGSTEIAMPPRFYPNGFEVTSSDPAGSWSYYLDDSRNVLHIFHDETQAEHSITIKAHADAKQLEFRELVNVKTGHCADFAGKLPTTGAAAITWSCEGKTWQRWAFDEEFGQLVSFQNPDYCLSHGDASQAVDGGQVAIAPCVAVDGSRSDDERWILDGNIIRNAHNPSIVLDAFGSNNGDTLGQWTYHGNANQRWHWAWHNVDESMHSAIARMQQGLSYDLQLQSTDDNCGLEWEGGNADRNNERNAKWDCSSEGDAINFVASTEPQRLAHGAVTIDGWIYSKDGQCGLEWDGHLNGNNERNAKWDCSGRADLVTLTATGTSGSMLVTSNNCGLEWHAQSSGNNEYNAKWDCDPRHDEVVMKQVKPSQFVELLNAADASLIGKQWNKLEGSNFRQVSVADDGSMWATMHNDDIYRQVNGQWQQVSGKLRQISVGSNGHVWGVNGSQNIYRWNGSSWSQVAGKLVSIAVDSDGSVWGTGADDRVWQFNGHNWTLKPGLLTNVSIAANGEVWGVNRGGNLYQFNGNGWNQISTLKKQVEVTSDGQVWVLGTSGEVSRYHNGEWLTVEGQFAYLSAAANQLIGTGKLSNVWSREFN
jgi:hypothetical protein